MRLIPDGSPFGLDNLPYGVFSADGGPPRVGVRVGDSVIGLAAALGDEVFAAPSLNPFMATGPANWARIRARAPNSLAGGMVDIASAMCTAADRDDAQAFFSGATQGMEGVKRPLDESLESAGLCIALRQHGAADVAQYLKKR